MALHAKIKVRWGYIVAFFMLLVSYFMIFYIIQQLSTKMSNVSNSHTVINTLESIKAEITDAETGVRGYIITSDTRFLKPYNTGSKNVIPLYRELRRLTTEQPMYRKQLDTLGSLLTRKLAHLAYSIRTYQVGGFIITPEMRARRDNSKTEMDSIRSMVAKLQEQEKYLMSDRTSTLNTVFNGTEIITIASLMIALITIFYSLITYNREKRGKEVADKNASSYSIQLEARVNELNKVNRELEELKSIEKFASTGRISRTIAHEVRNPLTNISLATEQLKEISTPGDESALLLDMISRNAVRINQMVSDLLNSTRFAQLDFTKVNINDLLDETLELARDRIGLSQALVKKNYDKEICEITVDREKIKLAFLNIIVNAIESMNKGEGILEISTSNHNGQCIIDFKDNGVGMDEDTLQKLFEPYFTVKPKGNGLGLTNSQNIILNHKGYISVKSKYGEGSVFTITLSEKSDT